MQYIYVSIKETEVRDHQTEVDELSKYKLIHYPLISSFDWTLIFVAFENRENSWKSPKTSGSVKTKSKTGANNCVAVISNCWGLNREW